MSLIALTLFHTPKGITGGTFTLTYFMCDGKAIFFKVPRIYEATYDGSNWIVEYEKETGIAVCVEEWAEVLAELYSDWRFIYQTYGLAQDETLSGDARELKRYILSCLDI